MKTSSADSSIINVTCAIIRNDDDEILIVQRGQDSDHPMKWEFPGGKTDKGESPEECIIREIREELSMDIVICNRLEDVVYDYEIKKIRLMPFLCDTLDELPVLNEHIAFKWIQAADLVDIDFSDADKIVAVNFLQTHPVNTEGKNQVVGQETTETDDPELREMIAETMGMKNAEWVADSAIDNPHIFRKLLEYSYSDDRKLAFRASWILTKACDKFPDYIYPSMPDVIESLGRISNESVQRSFLRIISLSELKNLSTRHHGLLADHCFSALRSGFSAIAIKAYSMEILYKLAIIYPELANELSAAINLLGEECSAGILARGKMILKKLAGMTTKP